VQGRGLRGWVFNQIAKIFMLFNLLVHPDFFGVPICSKVLALVRETCNPAAPAKIG